MQEHWSSKIMNPYVTSWITEFSSLVTPDNIHVCSGSDEEYDRLAAELVASGSFLPLNVEKKFHSFLARSDPRDVARVEKKTFICSVNKEDVGPTNNWEDPKTMRLKLNSLFKGCMKGRTLYVVPFCMSHLQSPFAVIGIELTDSPYVACSMKIMTRMGTQVLEELGETNNFIKCHHSVGQPLSKNQKDSSWPCNPEKLLIAHFHDDLSVWSYGSGYGGNALLGKKSVSLRIASYKAKNEGWLAEHMLIIGVTNPQKRKKYFAAAFPSACGKTNLSMLDSKLPGWKVECVGDDIAWLRWGSNGRLYAVNPEYGFFGVAPGTSVKTNPNALKACQQNSIFTNVALTEDGDVWWEGLTDTVPDQLIDWEGKLWDKSKGIPAAHPNSRFTVPLSQCPVLDPLWDSSEGVPISAIIFGGRRKDTVPLVLEALTWEHGVFIGAGMSSETTSAVEDVKAVIRHDPFAMLPFCGYNMADYFRHWLALSDINNNTKLPKIFGVNWFKKDSQGKYLWPGFGENIRVLEWIFNRTDENAEKGSVRTPIGFIPSQDFFNVSGLNLSPDALAALFEVKNSEWLKEIRDIRGYFEMFEEHLPHALLKEINRIESELK